MPKPFTPHNLAVPGGVSRYARSAAHSWQLAVLPDFPARRLRDQYRGQQPRRMGDGGIAAEASGVVVLAIDRCLGVFYSSAFTFRV
jgi:hypothetical protein